MTNQYEIDVEFIVNSDLAKSDGLAIQLLKRYPVFPDDYGELLGSRQDFNGFNVFLYKSKTRTPGKWVSLI
jgi:hypothetical protein